MLDILLWFSFFLLLKKAIFNTCRSPLPSLAQYTIFKMLLSLLWIWRRYKIQYLKWQYWIKIKDIKPLSTEITVILSGMLLIHLYSFKLVFCWPFPFTKPFSVWFLGLIQLKMRRGLWNFPSRFCSIMCPISSTVFQITCKLFWGFFDSIKKWSPWLAHCPAICRQGAVCCKIGIYCL